MKMLFEKKVNPPHVIGETGSGGKEKLAMKKKNHTQPLSKFTKGQYRRSDSELLKLLDTTYPKSPTEDSLTIPTIGDWKTNIKSQKLKPFIVDQLMSGQAGEYLMLSGRTGIGKTNVALWLAYCISTGHEFFGHTCKQLDVAYLSFEGAKSNYENRIKKIEKQFSPVEDRLHFDIISPNDPRVLYDESMVKLSKLSKCKVVILDGSYKLVNGDPSKTIDTKRFILQLKANLTELGMYCILIVQVNKPNKASLLQPQDIYSIAGSAGFANDCETALMLENKHRSKVRYGLHCVKSRIAVEEVRSKELLWNYETCSYTLGVNDEDAKSFGDSLAIS